MPSVFSSRRSEVLYRIGKMLNMCILLVLPLLLHFTDGYLQVQPTGTITKEFGETFVSFCHYNSTKVHRWSFGSQILTESQGSEVMTLEVEDVNFSSQGTYVCSDSDDKNRDTVKLLVYKRPVFVNMLKNQNLTFGKTGRIFCNVESENMTVYEWKLDGRSLPSSDRINITKDEYLEIDKVNENDAGVYECIATITSKYVTQAYSVDINVFVTGGQPVRPTIFTPSIPNAESTIVHRTEPEGHTARTTALFQTRPNAETTRPITHRTEPKGKPGGPSTRLPNTKTIKGIPSGRDDSNPNGGSEGKILFHRKFGNRYIGIVMLSIMSMLIITVP